MTECALLSTCLFFNDKLAGMPATAELLKHNYCRGGYSACARWMVRCALGKDAVPADLFPNARETAARLLLQAKSAAAPVPPAPVERRTV